MSMTPADLARDFLKVAEQHELMIQDEAARWAVSGLRHAVTQVIQALGQRPAPASSGAHGHGQEGKQ